MSRTLSLTEASMVCDARMALDRPHRSVGKESATAKEIDYAGVCNYQLRWALPRISLEAFPAGLGRAETIIQY